MYDAVGLGSGVRGDARASPGGAAVRLGAAPSGNVRDLGKREGPGRRGSVLSTTAQIGSLCFHGLFRHGRGGASTVKKSLPEPRFKSAAF